MHDLARNGPTIREAERSDTGTITRIYNHYVSETIVTFEEAEVATDETARRIDAVRADGLPWLVAVERSEPEDSPGSEPEAGRIVGYAHASRWRDRIGYRFTAEITAYVDAGCGGRGIGSALYGRLIPMLAETGVHVVVGGIALPNDASVALHEKFGLRKVAHFHEVGFKFGRWIDVGFWQREFELKGPPGDTSER